MSTDDFHVRVMTADEVAMATDWAAAEGWNPGLEDAAIFRAVDPDGFLLGLAGSEPVACVSVVNYDEATAFLGFYIARPAFRGKGFGWRTWQAGIARAGARRIGLDGVVDQQDNYRKSGFRLAWRNIRHVGTIAPTPEEDAGETPIPLTQVPIAEVAALDRATFPAGRTRFLSDWIAARGHLALGIRRNGRLAAFGVMRPCRTGFKVGPLVAPDTAAAEALFLAFVREADGAPLALDTPEPNAAAVDLATRHGLAPAFETARMWTGGEPPAAPASLYGVMSFELG